ncbi:hypothetical protein [Anaerococcus nagyae]
MLKGKILLFFYIHIGGDDMAVILIYSENEENDDQEIKKED